VAQPLDREAPPAPTPRMRRHLVSIEELLAWSSRTAPPDLDPPPPPHTAGRAQQAQRQVAPLPAGRPRVLHCHDMMGGYCRPADEGYLQCFSGWHAVDAIIYFAHHRVSIPPQCWIDACHMRGKPCLGTLITEGASGLRDNSLLLGRTDEAAERLADLCATYGFDGWLVNIESDVGASGVPALVDLLQLLTICTKQRVGDHALVIYYDSLDATTGRIAYQNALTPANLPFFDACDGIFTNYWWDARALAASTQLAGARRHDVYAGIDCFARGPNPHFTMPYLAGPGCATGVRIVADSGLSLAVFAPGWSLECGEACGKDDSAEAAQCDARFWEALGVTRLFGRRPE
jgi:mannosyl-glycoprotein endo-beta-N-acetylglucosaminidase